MKLLSRNLKSVTSIYDVFYNDVRNQLISKNVENIIFDKDIVERSRPIRDALISKFIESELNIDNIAESSRKALLSKNKMMEDSANIENIAKNSRKNLLSKNKFETTDLIGLASNIRIQNLSKNKNFNSDDILESSEEYRINLLSKNNSSPSDLLELGNNYRDNNISKNTNSKYSNLLDSSLKYRKSLLSKNKFDISTGRQSIDNFSESARNLLVSKNTASLYDLLENSENYRDSLLSKNNLRNYDLLSISDGFRDSNLSKNINRGIEKSRYENSIEIFSENYRNSNISKNIKIDNDLLDSSESYRRNLISKNIIRTRVGVEDFYRDNRSELLSRNNSKRIESIIEFSSDFRDGLLAKNTLKKLQVDNNLIRESLLSKNKYNVLDLEEFSEQFRKNVLSKNDYAVVDLDSISSVIRSSLLSYNISNLKSILDGSKTFRENAISKNEYEYLDLLDFSDSFRNNLLSLNIGKTYDLLSISSPYRDSLLKFNRPIDSDLLSSSVQFRLNLIGLNIGRFSDLLSLSEPFRNDLLSINDYATFDLLSISQQFREDLLSKNYYAFTDLLEQSEPFRDILLAYNISNSSDLLSESLPFRNNLLSLNVPSRSDLLSDSFQFRNDLLAANNTVIRNLLNDSEPFRNTLLSYNVSIQGDLLQDSEQYRNNLLAASATNNLNSDLLLDSEPQRQLLLSKNNVENRVDLIDFSTPFRENLLSKNEGGLIGIDIEAGGTSTFLGISRVLTQGIIYRALLLSRNKSDFQEETGRLLDDVVNNNYRKNALNKNVSLYETQRTSLQSQFGISNQFRQDIKVGGGAAYVSTTASLNGLSKGVYFEGDYGSTATIRYIEGDVTANARKLNVQKNAFVINASRNGYQPGAQDALNFLSSYSYGNFQDLIQKTIGGFSLPMPIETNSTPQSVINELQSTGGFYLKGGPSENILRPSAELGSPESAMAKTVAGNPFDEQEFKSGRRGVRRIINKIKESTNSDFAQNYDVQNQNVYIIGKSGEVKKTSSQRFTIANPYAPEGAQRLVFFLQNYSMAKQDQIMYFPPYVKDISVKHGANWNTINFLGRPEPVYTYNNGSRSGSISFMILTDYAQQVDLGVNWNSLEKLSYDFNGIRFTDFDRDSVRAEISFSTAKLNKIDSEIQIRRGDLSLLSGATETESKKIEINNLIKERNSLQSKIDELTNKSKGIPYSEQSYNGQNVYASATNPRNITDGYIDTKVANTVSRLDSMKKDLMFQPAFFSGDKIDFVKRLEFLGKLTLPSNNPASGGFSFIKPPVCHVHLGDIFNHDIIINSVDFDFNDLTWSLDGGKVYPLWATVNLSFDIVGPYRHGAGTVTSSMKGGIYSDKTSEIPTDEQALVQPYQEPEHF